MTHQSRSTSHVTPASPLVLATALWLVTISSTPAGQGTLVVLNKSEATASLIDLDAAAVAATVATGTGPHEVAVSPDGRLAVVCNYGTGPAPGSSLTVIDLPEARVEKTIDLGEYRRPHGIEWLSDGKHVLVTTEQNRKLLQVDVAAGKVAASFDTDQEISHMVVVTPNGARAFVASIGSGSVTAIDLAAGKRLKSVPTGAGAEGIAITPDGKEVWITNRAADTVSVVNASSLEIMKEIPSKSFPIRAKATPDGKHVLVSNAKSGDVAVFDVASKSEVHRIPMKQTPGSPEGRLFGVQFGDSPAPVGILVHPDGRRAYVANTNADVIAILDLQDWKVAGVLKAGKEPDGLGYSPLKVKPAPAKP
jgi:YVTN family beta-propeller protein